MTSKDPIIDLTHLTDEVAMEWLADYIDQAIDDECEIKAKKALSFCAEMEERLQGVSLVEIYYFRANIWSVIRQSKHQEESIIWLWDQPEILQEVYWLRYSICSLYFKELPPFRQCQILVNAGNILSHIGRLVEAIDYWHRALQILPNFGMAIGNLGFGYEVYAKTLYDPGHTVTILKHAYDTLNSVAENNVLWDGYGYELPKSQMLANANIIAEHVDFSQFENFDLDGFSLGKSKGEQQYRKWCLSVGLFINPLNELGPFNIAAKDVLHLPNMITDAGESPYLIGFYNQLKQEYCSARYTLWQGVRHSEGYKKHYSDHDILLIDTLDYPEYSYTTEQIKIAFRSAFSLFDKIAFFINEYWQLGIPENRVNFQSVWSTYDKKSKSKKLRSEFETHPNLSLRGLYWLSKDFIEEDNKADFLLADTMEPDAERLRTIRNHLEHKHLKVHDDIWAYDRDSENSYFTDNLAYHLSLSEITEKSIRIMKLARSALIYLSLAVHREEQIKGKDDSKFVMPMTLPIWERY